MPPPPALPVRRHTIGSFLNLLALLLASERTAEFVILLLTGQHGGEQASIEALENRIYNADDPDDEDDITLYPYTSSIDVDSAIGISDDICVSGSSIVFYVVPKFSHSLRKSVGLTRRVQINGVGTHVGLHELPNYLFAHWGVRNEIIIFFPGRYKLGQRDGYKMDNIDIASFFEHVTRPALQDTVPDLRAANLPPTYDAEVWRSKSEKGQYTSSGRVLSEETVADLAGELRDKLEDAIRQGYPLQWARGFFFVHQVRGVKDANVHAPAFADDAVYEFIASTHISLAAVEDYPENWFFDIGHEVGSVSSDDSLAWRADSHTALLRDVLQVPEGHAVRMTKMGSTSYYKDPVSHLTEVAGCRITPGVRGRGPLKIVKVQAYHTDKTVTASLHERGGYHAKHITFHQLLENKDGGFLDKLFQVYEESRKGGVVSKARLEVRVPFSTHRRVYDALRGVNWRRYLVAIPGEHWWKLRLYPLITYKAVVGSYGGAALADQTNINALGLLLVIVWLVNCLHATPDTGPSSRELLNAVLPYRRRDEVTEITMPYRLSRGRQGQGDGVEAQWEGRRTSEVEGGAVQRHTRWEDESSGEDTDEDEDEVQMAPAHPYGVFFVQQVLWDDDYRTPILGGRAARALKGSTFEYFAGMSYDDFADRIYDNMLFRPRAAKRTRNKTQQRPVILDEGESIPVVFSLKNGAREIPRPEWQGGKIDRGERDHQEMVTRNVFLSEIFHQLFVDTITLSPSPKNKPHAYTKIDNDHFPKVTIEVFKDRNPGKAFRVARMVRGTEKDWELVFKHVLPERGQQKTGDAQNYRKAAYYKMWGHFMASTPSDTTVKEARKAFKEKFFAEIAWFPWAKAGRLWESNGKPIDRDTIVSTGLKEKEPAPWILLRKHCSWNAKEKWTPWGTESEEPEGDD